MDTALGDWASSNGEAGAQRPRQFRSPISDATRPASRAEASSGVRVGDRCATSRRNVVGRTLDSWQIPCCYSGTATFFNVKGLGAVRYSGRGGGGGGVRRTVNYFFKFQHMLIYNTLKSSQQNICRLSKSLHCDMTFIPTVLAYYMIIDAFYPVHCN